MVDFESYYNSYKRVIIDIGEGEEVCRKCRGKGEVILRTPNYVRHLCCDKCLGTGKIDWVEKAIGKRVKNE